MPDQTRTPPVRRRAPGTRRSAASMRRRAPRSARRRSRPTSAAPGRSACVAPAFVRVVALHAETLAADRDGLQPMARPTVATGEAVACREMDAARRPARPRPVHLADTRHAKRGRLGFERRRLEIARRGRRRRIDQIERARIPARRQFRRIRQPAERILRRLPRHGDRALGHRSDGLRPGVGRRDAGLPPPDQHPQTDVDALRPLGLLERAAAHLDRQAVPCHRERIGGLGPRAGGGVKQCRGQVAEPGHAQTAPRSAPRIRASVTRARTPKVMAAPAEPLPARRIGLQEMPAMQDARDRQDDPENVEEPDRKAEQGEQDHADQGEGHVFGEIRLSAHGPDQTRGSRRRRSTPSPRHGP